MLHLPSFFKGKTEKQVRITQFIQDTVLVGIDALTREALVLFSIH